MHVFGSQSVVDPTGKPLYVIVIKMDLHKASYVLLILTIARLDQCN